MLGRRAFLGAVAGLAVLPSLPNISAAPAVLEPLDITQVYGWTDFGLGFEITEESLSGDAMMAAADAMAFSARTVFEQQIFDTFEGGRNR